LSDFLHLLVPTLTYPRKENPKGRKGKRLPSSRKEREYELLRLLELVFADAYIEKEVAARGGSRGERGRREKGGGGRDVPFRKKKYPAAPCPTPVTQKVSERRGRGRRKPNCKKRRVASCPDLNLLY